jgi:chaperonin GroES
MFDTFKPINDNILVELAARETKTAGGIIVPTEAQEKTQKGYVVNSGKSEQFTRGNYVFFKKFMGTALDEKYLVLREEDILGIL